MRWSCMLCHAENPGIRITGDEGNGILFAGGAT